MRSHSLDCHQLTILKALVSCFKEHPVRRIHGLGLLGCDREEWRVKHLEVLFQEVRMPKKNDEMGRLKDC